jgi:hypothetical protein
MAFQVRVGPLIVIAKSRTDAISLLDRLSEGHFAEDVSVSDMQGKPLDIERLRAGSVRALEPKCENAARGLKWRTSKV